jgi:hypothetical protein
MSFDKLKTVLLAMSLSWVPFSVFAATPKFERLPTGQPSQIPFIAWHEDLGKNGYAEEEYLAKGQANVYEYVRAGDPSVQVKLPAVPYVTRVLVRYPTDRSKFNGTVYVEVLNATAGWDGDPTWQAAADYLMRSGAAWVGVSTKPVTVDFLRDRWGRDKYPTRDTGRYAALSMPHFGQVWDMMTDVGKWVRTPGESSNPLNKHAVKRLFMVGFSQSVAYQVTYANSFHARARMPSGQPVYDGYYLGAGGSRGKDVTAATPQTESLGEGDPRNLIRVDVPVVRLQTQTEVIGFGSYRVRQDDKEFPLVRTYEVAGGSHVDAHLDEVGGIALARDLGLPPSFCPKPDAAYNPVRTGFYQAAALEILDRWSQGVLPPASRLYSLTQEGGKTVMAKDTVGNVVGGVRPPELEAPRGVYLESNSGPGFCRLYGGFVPFIAEKLKEIYPGSGSFATAFDAAIDRAVKDRFLLPEDASLLRSSRPATLE